MEPLLGRGRHLTELRRSLDSPDPGLILLTGPRGSGKTALLAEALRGRRALHLQAAELTSGDLLADLRVLSERVLGEVPTARRPGVLPIGPGRGEWASLLLGLVDHVAETGRPLILALDGFEAVLRAHRRVGTELSDLLEAAAIRGVPFSLVLTARREGAFEPVIGGGEAVEVRTHLTLDGLPYRNAGWAHGARDPRDAFLRWAIFGDHPAHLRTSPGPESLGEAVVRRVLSPDGDLFDGPLRRLEAGFRRPARYAAILRALATGPLEWSGILAAARGIDSGSQLAPYLRSLEEEGLVRMALPLGAAPESRSRRYAPADPFLGFWFGWVLPVRSLLPQLGAGVVWRELILPGIQVHLQHCMEEVARRWIAEHAEEDMGAAAREVGALWGGEADFPVAGRLHSGQVCYGLVDWSGHTGDLPGIMRQRMQETRYGIGRQARIALYFLAQPPDEAIRRSAARGSAARVISFSELFGEVHPGRLGSGPAPKPGPG